MLLESRLLGYRVQNLNLNDLYERLMSDSLFFIFFYVIVFHLLLVGKVYKGMDCSIIYAKLLLYMLNLIITCISGLWSPWDDETYIW
jgi:hypothetical protein